MDDTCILWIMLKRLVSFFVLSRPLFLLGGVLLYWLGISILLYEGFEVNWLISILGQFVVSGIQLMTHYLNDYWDIETDRQTTHRTFFSGGSGVLPAGDLPRLVAMIAALVCLTVSLSLMAVLIVLYRVPFLSWLIFAVAALGAYSYSSPAIKLAATGFGELATACIVSLLVPGMAYSLQTGTLGGMLFLACAPLIAINWAMIVTFQFPDYEADMSTGKETILVRLGYLTTVRLHWSVTLGAFGLLLVGYLFGLPVTVAGLPGLTLPLALIEMTMVRKIAKGESARYGWLTFVAVTLLAAASALELVGFLLSSLP